MMPMLCSCWIMVSVVDIAVSIGVEIGTAGATGTGIVAKTVVFCGARLEREALEARVWGPIICGLF